jgi:hypothetical protein
VPAQASLTVVLMAGPPASGVWVSRMLPESSEVDETLDPVVVPSVVEPLELLSLELGVGVGVGVLVSSQPVVPLAGTQVNSTW